MYGSPQVPRQKQIHHSSSKFVTASNFFSLKITKVSKVFINNMFLGIEIYYINILFGLLLPPLREAAH
jgi:hypothetical protein